MSDKLTCQYGECQNEATTRGFVLAYEPTHPNGHVVEYVNACDKHKKKRSFFKTADLEKEERNGANL
jgi:hypothetical protein